MKYISKREELLNKLTRVGPAEVAFVECFFIMCVWWISVLINTEIVSEVYSTVFHEIFLKSDKYKVTFIKKKKKKRSM